MERAAIVIGVSRAGDMPQLRAVGQGVQAVAEWARDQGFASIDVITDESRPVKVTEVEDTVAAVIDRSTVEQLIIYFSGHGQNNGLTEYWLLSDAPARSSAAVNVDGSARLARYCGIPHIVLISDACRTAADGVISQAVQGTIVFPNDPVPGPGRPVDVFYACSLGSPALEVRSAQEAAGAYQAVYTNCLVSALTGAVAPNEAGFLERLEGTVHVVRPWPLRTHLEGAVARRLAGLQPDRALTQTPDAQINSPATAWLSRIDVPVRRGGPVRPLRLPIPETVGFQARTALEEALGQRSAQRSPAVAVSPAEHALTEAVDRQMRPFDTNDFETGCGITIRGAGIATVWGGGTQVELMSSQLVRATPEGPAGNVLLSFDNDTSTVLPVIAGFLTRLTVEDGELVEVAFEPSAKSPQRGEYESRRNELEELRALISVATRHGTFRLDTASAQALGARLQVAKGVDPTMAVHAAYAYDTLQRPDLVEDMQSRLADTIGIRLFDVALVAREAADTPAFPPVPMLARGWALLDAYKPTFTAIPPELHRHLLPSVWTLFSPKGLSYLRDAMEANL